MSAKILLEMFYKHGIIYQMIWIYKSRSLYTTKKIFFFCFHLDNLLSFRINIHKKEHIFWENNNFFCSFLCDFNKNFFEWKICISQEFFFSASWNIWKKNSFKKRLQKFRVAFFCLVVSLVYKWIVLNKINDAKSLYSMRF